MHFTGTKSSPKFLKLFSSRRGFPTIAMYHLFVCLYFGCFTSQVNSYGIRRTVSSPNHTFFPGKLEQAVNQYFVHILSLVTVNSPS